MKKLTAAAALLIMLVTAPAAHASTHVRIHVKTISNSSATNPVTTTPAVEESPTGLKIGGVVELDPTQYQIAKCAPQVWNVTRAKATAVWLEFDSINAPGDQMVVSAPNGSFSQVFDVAPDGITTLPIPGKALKIEFRPSNASNMSASGCAATGKLPSFTLTKLGYGLQTIKKEKKCGNEVFKSAKCLPQWTIKTGPIMRLKTVINGAVWWCTAWLWGNKGHIITNHHCISSQALVDMTQFQFQVEMPKCEDKACDPFYCQPGETLSGRGNVVFIGADKSLDYAVVQIKSPSSYVQKYGYLQIRDGTPKRGESFNIVQHLGGGPKVVSYTTDSSKTLQPLRVSMVITDIRGAPANVFYEGGADEGSSGSPLVSLAGNDVIGLHYASLRGDTCTNKATSSNKLAYSLQARNIQDNDGFVTARATI